MSKRKPSRFPVAGAPAGSAVLLQDGDVQALTGQQGGGGQAGDAAANDDGGAGPGRRFSGDHGALSASGVESAGAGCAAQPVPVDRVGRDAQLDRVGHPDPGGAQPDAGVRRSRRASSANSSCARATAGRQSRRQLGDGCAGDEQVRFNVIEQPVLVRLGEGVHGDAREVAAAQCLEVLGQVAQEVDLLEGGAQPLGSFAQPLFLVCGNVACRPGSTAGTSGRSLRRNRRRSPRSWPGCVRPG